MDYLERCLENLRKPVAGLIENEDLCSVCNAAHTEEMVLCDRCGHWFHFQCVNMDSEIANSDDSWFCDLCEKIICSIESFVIQQRADVQTEMEKLEGFFASVSHEDTGECGSGAAAVTSNVHASGGLLTVRNSNHPSVQPHSLRNQIDMNHVQRVRNQRGIAISESMYQQRAYINRQPVPIPRCRNELFCGSDPVQNLENDEFIAPRRLIQNVEGGDQFVARGPVRDMYGRELIDPLGPVHRKPYFNYDHHLARKTLCADLPKFTGRIAEWPLFITSFEESTRLCGYTQRENCKRLEKCLQGTARDDVLSLLIFPANVPYVIETLRMKYGKPSMVVNSLLIEIDKLPPVPRDNMGKIIDFSIRVNNVCSMIRACNQPIHFRNQLFLQRLASKLPINLMRLWTIHKMTIEQNDIPNMLDFNNWLRTQADIASDTMTDEMSYVNVDSTVRAQKPDTQTSRRRTSPVIMHNEEKTAATNPNCFETCAEYLSLERRRRWDMVTAKEVCSSYLKQKHPLDRRPNKQTCGVGECTQKVDCDEFFVVRRPIRNVDGGDQFVARRPVHVMYGRELIDLLGPVYGEDQFVARGPMRDMYGRELIDPIGPVKPYREEPYFNYDHRLDCKTLCEDSYQHHRLLHGRETLYSVANSVIKQNNDAKISTSCIAKLVGNHPSNHRQAEEVLFNVLPVTLYGMNNNLDDGSVVTLV